MTRFLYRLASRPATTSVFAPACMALLLAVGVANHTLADEPKPAAIKPAKPQPDAVTRPDEERILGTWVLARGNRPNAKDGDDENGTKVTLTFAAENRWTAVVDSQGAKQEIGGTYFLDPKQTPKLFDLTLTAGDFGLSVFAIYELSDDRLRLRFHLDGGQRPADFASPAEGASLYMFQREAK